MTDIELVIKIPESRYRLLQTQSRTNLGREKLDEFAEAILNGTPLPKGYWIHRTQDGECFWEECSVCHTERAFSTKYCPDCGTYMYAESKNLWNTEKI